RFGEIYELDPDDFPEEGVIIKAYLAKTSLLHETLDEIKKNIANLKNFNIDIGENKLGLSDVKEEDWATAWKKYYHPVNVSERFTIVP
ncbi:50S ribosomal protein L11 methyltransferase, partial [Butyricicoccus sp. 1XD8-22]